MTAPAFRTLLLNLFYIFSLSSSGIMPPKQAEEYVQCTAPISKHDLESVLDLVMTSGKETDDGSIFVKYLDKSEKLDKNTERRIYFRISYIPVPDGDERENKGTPYLTPAVFLPVGYKCLVTRVGILIEDWKKALISDEGKRYNGFKIFQTSIDDFGEECNPDGIPNSMRTRFIEETLEGRALTIGRTNVVDLSQPENKENAQEVYNRSVNEILREYMYQKPNRIL